jgi:hypothetical protein
MPKLYYLFTVLILGLLFLGCVSVPTSTPKQATCPSFIVGKANVAGSIDNKSTIALSGVSINFTDGRWTFIFTSYLSCERGHLEGQNINYYYCSSNWGTGWWLGFKRTIVDSTGNISEADNLMADLIVEPTNITYLGSSGVSRNVVITELNIIGMECYNTTYPI